MDLSAEREMLKKEIDKIDDIRLLEAIRRVLDGNRSKVLAKPHLPLTEDEYFDRIKESRKAIEEGKLIIQEEAIAYFRKKNG